VLSVTTNDDATEPDEQGGILRISPDGPAIAATQDALDLIGEAWGANASTIVVPAERFDPAFFDLRSGLLGEVTQKFVNYRLRLVVIGDVSAHVAASDAFRDYVRETNAGGHVWFVADQAELDARLGVDA
jgi:hypothetical protein